MPKILEIIHSCKKCPHRHYYSAGQYECMKYGTVLPPEHDGTIPDWCPLPNLPQPPASDAGVWINPAPNAAAPVAAVGTITGVFCAMHGFYPRAACPVCINEAARAARSARASNE